MAVLHPRFPGHGVVGQGEIEIEIGFVNWMDLSMLLANLMTRRKRYQGSFPDDCTHLIIGPSKEVFTDGGALNVVPSLEQLLDAGDPVPHLFVNRLAAHS
jgi:hypothetical protein